MAPRAERACLGIDAMGARKFRHEIGWHQFDELPQHCSVAAARLFRGFLFHTLPHGRKNSGSRATLCLPLWDGCDKNRSLARSPLVSCDACVSWLNPLRELWLRALCA